MNRLLLAGALAASLIGALASPLDAQVAARRVSAGIGGGASIPTGELGDATETGFNALGLVALRLTAIPVAFRGDLSYHRFGLSDAGLADLDDPLAEGYVRAIAGSVGLEYAPVTRRSLTPYLVGGGGFYDVKIRIAQGGDAAARSASEVSRNLGLTGGAGIRVARGPVRGFVEARVHSVATDGRNTMFVPITAGVTF